MRTFKVTVGEKQMEKYIEYVAAMVDKEENRDLAETVLEELLESAGLTSAEVTETV